MKKLIILLINFLILFTLSYSDTIEKTLIPEGTQIKGLKKIQDSYFYIEENLEIEKEPTIELNLSFSDLTLQDKSTITCLVNDKPLKSFYLKSNNGELKNTLKVPNNLIVKGKNKFSISKMQLLSENNCSLDAINPSNWVTVNKAILKFNYKENNKNVNLSNLPLPFMNKYEESGAKIINIFMSNHATGAEKIALLNSAAFGGKFNENSLDKVKIMDIKDAEKFSDNAIIISEFDRLPKFFKDVFTNEEIKLLDGGVALKIIDNPINTSKKILIQTSNSKNLGNGANWLIDENIFKQLSGNFVIIRDYSENKYDAIAFNNNLTFKELGIPNIKLSGNGYSKEKIQLSIPRYRIRENLVLNLKLNYSNLLLDTPSTLEIKVNGESLWNNEIGKSKEKLSELKIPIPKELHNNKNKYDIEIESNLILNYNCGEIPNPWIEIKNTSIIESRISEKEKFSLDDFPAPFVKDGKYNKLAVSISDDFKSLEFAAELFRMVGSSLKYPGTIVYLQNNDVDKNTIIIGNPKDNPIIKELQNKLFLKYDRNNEKFLSDYRFQFLGDNKYSALQIYKDESTFNMLVFTDENMYYDNILNKLKEHITVDDNYIAINEKDGAIVKIEEKNDAEKTIIRDVEKNILKILGIIIGFFIAIGAVLYIYKKKNYN